MQHQCPKCGTQTTGLGSRGLCKTCFLEEEDLVAVPDEITVQRCRHCGDVAVRGDWVAVEDEPDLLSTVLEQHVPGDRVAAVSYRPTDDGYVATILAEHTVDGQELQQEAETRIVTEPAQCDTCAKFHGGFYRYVLQIRGDDLEDALDVAMRRAASITAEDRTQFVSDVEEEAGGYNLYISTRQLAEEVLKALQQQYGVEKKRSKELVGREDGQDVYRTVISVRIQ